MMVRFDMGPSGTLASLTVPKQPPGAVHGRGRAGLAAGVAAAFVLLVVAVTVAASSANGRSRQFELPRIGWLIDLVVAVTIPAGIVLFVIALRRSLGEPTRRRPPSIAASLAFVVVLVALALLFRDRFATSGGDDAGARDPGAGGQAGPDAPMIDPAPPTSGAELAAVVTVLAGGAVLTVLLARRLATTPHPRGASGPPRGATPGSVVGDVLDDAIAALRADTDPRRAVIAAYARMEQTLGHHGLARQAPETPIEYLARVLQRIDVSAGAATRLTEQFERALYSTHRFDRAEQDDAVAALVTVRDELWTSVA